MRALASEAEVSIVKGLSRPFKVCFEGIDGCGKSTQVELLVRRLREEGLEAAVVKHPGFTRFGREVRKLLLSGAQADADLASRLLFWADHIDAVANLPEADVVVFDRHPRYSNYAYGAAMGTPVPVLVQLDDILSGFGAVPDLTFVIDVPAEVAWRRMEARGGLTVIERRGLEYFRKVRHAYLELAEHYLEVAVVRGDGAPEAVHQKVLEFFGWLAA
ncbi:MAG: dTMP kinase [Moorellales bacterium]